MESWTQFVLITLNTLSMSFIPYHPESHFSINNIPFGVFSLIGDVSMGGRYNEGCPLLLISFYNLKPATTKNWHHYR